MIKETIISVTGLGYVGLPVALAFAAHFKVIGFDINLKRITELQQGHDSNNDVAADAFDGKEVLFTNEIEDLQQADFHIVAVPTSIDAHQTPDLSALERASITIGQVIKKGDCVVYESTVYPGCTEEFCVPLIEKQSGLAAHTDFMVGYSPERINPGDRVRTIENVVKIVAGSTPEALQKVKEVYAKIVAAGLCEVSNIKVAEAAKALENTQRDLNIALMNEMSMICERLGINTYEVIDAAATKWNFLRFQPGLVGGHCIGIDPFYLTHKAKALGYDPAIILSGRKVNDQMGNYIAHKTVQQLARTGKSISEARILVMGITFKEDISDIRNSKVTDIVKELQQYGISPDITDPYAAADKLEHEYGLILTEPKPSYDAIVLAVAHTPYLHFTKEDFAKMAPEGCLFVDVKGKFKSKIPNNFSYWSL